MSFASLSALLTASLVISKNNARLIGGAFFPLICCSTCHAIASPSRSGSVAMNTAFAVFAALLSSATVFSLPGIVTYCGSKPCSVSMPMFFTGRSRMWPTVAFTAYAFPRYLPMVFALAGDSTMTSDLPAADRAASSSCGSSGSTKTFFGRAVFFAADVAGVFFAAFLATFFLAVAIRTAILVPDFL